MYILEQALYDTHISSKDIAKDFLKITSNLFIMKVYILYVHKY